MGKIYLYQITLSQRLYVGLEVWHVSISKQSHSPHEHSSSTLQELLLLFALSH